LKEKHLDIDTETHQFGEELSPLPPNTPGKIYAKISVAQQSQQYNHSKMDPENCDKNETNPQLSTPYPPSTDTATAASTRGRKKEETIKKASGRDQAITCSLRSNHRSVGEGGELAR
jgi:hypothetical protein